MLWVDVCGYRFYAFSMEEYNDSRFINNPPLFKIENNVLVELAIPQGGFVDDMDKYTKNHKWHPKIIEIMNRLKKERQTKVYSFINKINQQLPNQMKIKVLCTLFSILNR